ncbi:hypothetical protein PSEUBRA_006160 [Kalmanozyma brasiliensis GHG001]|uniref:uncharacterized protein n=1 Tax=Kalmanozyma brasiliensis (strain GHG001) TaxID=1365824 RepID=UPI001CEBFCBF|nr:uncharacterized protein PSEUBRA_006160 [Kalmanozyma brasiliensis GHG001]KAF6767633.1 hypothetical protein PSEUBRA_006160 [Kalmanozyma brasiliensis GHG001]
MYKMRKQSFALWLLSVFAVTALLAAAPSKAHDELSSGNEFSSEHGDSPWTPGSDDTSSANSNEIPARDAVPERKHREVSLRIARPSRRPAVASGAKLGHVPTHRDALGVEWGPYPVHASKFQLHFYPLHEPTLADIYQRDQSMPVAFAPPSRRFASRYPWLPAVYRPEPEVLQRLRSKILGRLHSTGWNAKEVHRNHPGFLQGMYLWPPLENSLSGYQMPKEILENHLLKIPRDRLRRVIKAPPNLYLFTVDSSTGPRSILGTTVVKNEALTPIHGQRRPESVLWLFYERRQPPHRTRKMTAFLGAMFLPKGAQRTLLGSGDITVFKHL